MLKTMKKALGIVLAAIMIIGSGIPMTAKAAENVTLALDSHTAHQDSEKRYCVYFTGFTEEQILQLNNTQVTLYIDGVEKTHNDMRLWDTSIEDLILLTVPYDVLESGVESCFSFAKQHTVWVKTGTVFKDAYTVTNDIILNMNANVITELAELPEEPEEEEEEAGNVTLTYTSGAAQEPGGAYTGAPRYCLYFTGLSNQDFTKYTQPEIYIDGVKASHVDMGFWPYDENVLLTVPFEALEEGVTDRWGFQEKHTIWIKAGTVVNGTRTITNDVMIELDKNTITDVSSTLADRIPLSVKQLTTEDTYKRYGVYLNGLDDTKLSAYTRVTLYVDGVPKTHNDLGIWPYGDHVLLTVPYDVLESGVTKYEDLASPHTFELRSGTMVGDYPIANDVSISADGGTIKETSALEEVQFELLSQSAAQDNYGNGDPARRYLLYLGGVTSEQITGMHKAAAKVTIDETSTAAPYYWNTLGDGTAITMILDYANLEDGVTAAADFAEQHMVTINKGTIIAEKYLVTEDLMIQLNKGEITMYKEPDLIEPEVIDAVTASVSGTTLTVGGTGTIKASDLASVTAADITKIKIEGPCDIASQAFAGFTALKEVYFSNTVLTAADDAFSGCASGVKAIYVKDRSVTGGLADVDAHEYYSFKIVTIGSSYGEDMNNYIYTLAKEYYGSLPGRTAEDIAYDDIVIAELFTGGGTLAQRVNGILGNPVITCYYEKWDENGAVIPTAPTGQLTGDNMRMALQDEYWDVVIMMQSAEDSRKASSFLVDTAGEGRADIDTVINFIKANNKNHSGSQYMWLQTWSYNYKLNAQDNYEGAISWEEDMRLGIVNSMQTVVQERIDAGALDGIVPAGAAIENLKNSYLNAKDPDYVQTHTSGTYNEGNYSNYFAIQRDTAHASIGLGRFTLGLTAFSYLAGLETEEIEALSDKCYPQNYEECEVSKKLEGEQAPTFAYLKYDEYTKYCAPQAAQAAIYALADPYNTYEVTQTCQHVFEQKVESAETLKEAATCGKDAQYYYSCACGAISTTEFYTAEGTATGAHTGGTATCKNPAQCSICGVSYGERDAKNHDHGSLKMGTVKVALYGHDDVKVSWSKVKDATSYTVYYKKASAKKYTKLTTTTKTYATKAGLSDGIKYTFKVVANNTENKITCSGTEKAVSIYTLKKLNAPKLSRVSSSKVKITWKNIDGESGYEISQSTKKSKTKVVYTYRTTSGKSRTIKAKAGQTFYYKVRAYKTVNGKKIYSPWSNVKSYKVKK